MKILIVSDAWHPQVNGVVRTYENLIPELHGLGHQVEVIGPGEFSHAFPCPNYPEIKLAFFGGRYLRERIRFFAPDHIHIATEGPLGWSARKIARQRKLPFSTCYHTHFPDYISQRLPKRLSALAPHINATVYHVIKRFHNPAGARFVVSDVLGSHLRQKGFSLPLPIMTRGVNTEIFHVGEKTKFKELKKPIALYVGRISVEKNIEAFLDTRWDGSKVVVGHGPAEAALKAAYPDVHFVGAKTGKELGDCYRSADLFVFPSKTDTFGMVNVEALACGLPVAAYPVMGPAAIITSPELGCLHEDLETAMKNAIFSPGSAEFRQNHAKNVYSWGEAATQFLSAIQNYG